MGKSATGQSRGSKTGNKSYEEQAGVKGQSSGRQENKVGVKWTSWFKRERAGGLGMRFG